MKKTRTIAEIVVEFVATELGGGARDPVTLMGPMGGTSPREDLEEFLDRRDSVSS